MNPGCIIRALAAGTLLASGAAASSAIAQDGAAEQAVKVRDGSAVAVLEAAQAALAEVTSLTVDVDRTMVVIEDELAPENAMITSIKLNSRGTLKGARGEDGGWIYRIDGYADNIGQPDAFRLTIVREPNKVSWLNYNKEKMYVSRPRLARGAFISSEESVSPDLWFQNPGFEAELAAEELISRPPTEIDGSLCDVVRVNYGGRLPARLYFDRETRQLRRAVRILVPGYEEVTEISSLDTETGVDPDLLKLTMPEGWTAVYQPATLDPERAEATRTPTRSIGSPNRSAAGEAGGAVGQSLPPFASVTMLGEEVSKDTLAGKPAVLVFWASWIPGAADTIGDITSLTEHYGDRVGLLTFTLRERNPDAAFNMLIEAGLDEVPLVIEGRDAIVNLDVLRAPTFIVADGEGTITFRADRYEAGTTLDEVRAALDALLSE